MLTSADNNQKTSEAMMRHRMSHWFFLITLLPSETAGTADSRIISLDLKSFGVKFCSKNTLGDIILEDYEL